jgi:hypothetical protein
MCFIHGRGAVTCLPSMTYAPEAHVDGAGIFGVNPPKGAGEGVRALRRGHQVNVIGPEAVAQDGDAMVTPTALFIKRPQKPLDLPESVRYCPNQQGGEIPEFIVRMSESTFSLQKGVDRMNRVPYLFAAGFLILLLAVPVRAQNITGTLTGIVTDSTGSAIPTAQVVLINQATAGRQTTSTNDAGIFLFASILPGTYTVEISMGGFRSYQVKDINVTMNERRTLGNVVLQVGQVQERVEVTAEATPVQTASSERAGLITTTQLLNTAIRGRDFVSLIATLPGVYDENMQSRDVSKGPARAASTSTAAAPLRSTSPSTASRTPTPAPTAARTSSRTWMRWPRSLFSPATTRPSTAATAAAPSTSPPRAARRSSTAAPIGSTGTKASTPTASSATARERSGRSSAFRTSATLSAARSTPRTSTRTRTSCSSSGRRSSCAGRTSQQRCSSLLPPPPSGRATSRTRATSTAT